MDSNTNPDSQVNQGIVTSAVEIFNPELAYARIPEKKDSEEAAAFLQQLDQGLVDQTRQAAGVAEVLGDQANEVFARVDRARAAALQQWAAESAQSARPRLQTVAWRITAPARPAIAQQNGAGFPQFIVALSPGGFADKVIEWKQKYDDEFPDLESGTATEEDGVKSTVIVSKRLEGDSLVVDAKLTSSLPLTNPPGATLAETIQGTIKVKVCPDPAGNVQGSLSIVASSAVGSSASGETKITSTINGQVNDGAELTGYTNQISASLRMTGTSTSGNPTGMYGEFQMEFTFDMSSGERNIAQMQGGEVRRSSKVPNSLMNAFTEKALDYIFWLDIDVMREAEKLWRNGYCVEVIVVDPVDGTNEGLLPLSEQPLTAEVRHRRGGDPVVARIEAWMASGETSVAPSNQPIPSPATFIFTAPSAKDSAGTVGLRTVSKRGIAETEALFNTYLPEFLLIGKVTGSGVDPSTSYYTYTGQLLATFSVELKPVQKAGGLMWEGTGLGELSTSQEFHEILYNCSSNVTKPISMQVKGLYTDGELWVNYLYQEFDLKYLCWFSFSPFEAPLNLANAQTFVFGVNDTVFNESTQKWPFGAGGEMPVIWEVEARRK